MKKKYGRVMGVEEKMVIVEIEVDDDFSDHQRLKVRKIPGVQMGDRVVLQQASLSALWLMPLLFAIFGGAAGAYLGAVSESSIPVFACIGAGVSGGCSFLTLYYFRAKLVKAKKLAWDIVEVVRG